MTRNRRLLHPPARIRLRPRALPSPHLQALSDKKGAPGAAPENAEERTLLTQEQTVDGTDPSPERALRAHPDPPTTDRIRRRLVSRDAPDAGGDHELFI